MYDTILVGIDGSDRATRALEHAIGVVRTNDATLLAVTVVDPGESQLSFRVREVDELNHVAADRVCEMVAASGDQDVEIRADVRREEPAEGLLEYADEAGADLIVVGKQGAGGLSGRVMGSTADRLARTSEIPMTVVPDE